MTAKVKYPKLISPVGVAAYAWIKQPDDKFNKDKPQYKMTLVLDESPATDAFIKRIEDLGKEFATAAGIKLRKQFKMPIKTFEDDEKEEFEGKVRIEAKSLYQPGQVDASTKPLPENIWVMSGDTVRCSLLVGAYEGMGSGINLKLRNVQLIEKSTSVGEPGDDFDAVDGFSTDGDDSGDGEDF